MAKSNKQGNPIAALVILGFVVAGILWVAGWFMSGFHVSDHDCKAMQGSQGAMVQYALYYKRSIVTGFPIYAEGYWQGLVWDLEQCVEDGDA